MKKIQKRPKSKVQNIIEWSLTGVIGVVFLFVAACNISKLSTKNSYGYGNSFGYSYYVVLTDSMEPSYKVNTAIITHKDSPEEIYKAFNEIKDLDLSVTDERTINLTFVDAYKGKHASEIPLITNQTNPTKAVMTHQLFKCEINENKKEGEGRYLFYVHGINNDCEKYPTNQYQVFTEKELLGRVKSNSKFLGGLSKFLTSVWGLFICLLIPALYLIIQSVIDIFKAYATDEETSSSIPNTSSGTLNNVSDEEYQKLKEEMINDMLNGKDKK